MSSAFVEADRKGRPGFSVLFGRDDGATRIWAAHVAPPSQFRLGVHRHGGDEIWRVQRGTIRITVGDEHIDCGAGTTVVVPPEVPLGVIVLSDDAEAEVIGELAMGEWVTVIDPDGTWREVEVHVPFIPWHRPVPDGTPPTDRQAMLAMREARCSCTSIPRPTPPVARPSHAGFGTSPAKLATPRSWT